MFALTTLFALAAPVLPQEDEAAIPYFDATRGLVSRAAGAFDGYTLFPPLRSTTTYLVDMDGEVVHTWESEHRPGNSTYLLDDGSLLRCARVENPVFSGGGQGGRVQRFSWEGELLWDLDWSNEEHMQHHDVEPLPNGNVLVIAWEHRTREEALAAGRDPAHLNEDGLWPDYVVELEPVRPDGAKVVWEWHAWDHLIQDLDEARANFGDVTAHPERIDVNGDHRDVPPVSAEERRRLAEVEAEMRALGYAGEDEPEPEGDGAAPDGGRPPPGDWLHTNGIDYHPELDLIVLSVRRFHELWVIDHSTTTAEAAGSRGGRWGRGGDLLYRWGNPRTYGRGTDDDQRLFGQHDGTWVAGSTPGVPHLLVFNNGSGRPDGEWSSVEEIAPPFDPERGFPFRPAGAFPPEEPAWIYVAAERESFYSSFISGAQRLPNGNTLVCSGAPGRLFEVTRGGEVVWDYLNPFGKREEPTEPPSPAPDPPAATDGAPAEAGVAVEEPPPHPRRGRRIPKGLFRGTRLAPDHPGLAGRDLRPVDRR